MFSNTWNKNKEFYRKINGGILCHAHIEGISFILNSANIIAT